MAGQWLAIDLLIRPKTSQFRLDARLLGLARRLLSAGYPLQREIGRESALPVGLGARNTGDSR